MVFGNGGKRVIWELVNGSGMKWVNFRLRSPLHRRSNSARLGLWTWQLRTTFLTSFVFPGGLHLGIPSYSLTLLSCGSSTILIVSLAMPVEEHLRRLLPIRSSSF